MPPGRLKEATPRIASMGTMRDHAEAITRAWVQEQRAQAWASVGSQGSTQTSSSSTSGSSGLNSAALSQANTLGVHGLLAQSRKRRATAAPEEPASYRQGRRRTAGETSQSGPSNCFMPPPPAPPQMAHPSHRPLLLPSSNTMPSLFEVLSAAPGPACKPMPDNFVQIIGRRHSIACETADCALIESPSRGLDTLNTRVTVWADGREVSATVRILRAYLRR